MNRINIKNLFPLIPVAAILLSATAINITAATDYCTSETCKAATKKYEESIKASEEAKNKAYTLQGEIERLEKDIETMEKRIEANEALVEDVKAQIIEQENILAEQQAGFAEIYTEAYFEQEESELIKTLKYKTFSERAEKEARDENIKAQISSSANTVKETMESLKMKQAQVEALIEDQKIQNAAIEENKAKQTELKEKYENDASTFAEDAKEAERIKGEEIAKEIAAHNSVGKVVASGTNSYRPTGSYQCPQDNYTNNGGVVYYDTYGFVICQCTSYANKKFVERWGRPVTSYGITGDAKYWGHYATANGILVDSTPEAHAVGVQTAGRFGHVVWIEAVNDDGTVDLSEYNNSYSSVSGMKGDYGYRVNVPASSFQYIHIR